MPTPALFSSLSLSHSSSCSCSCTCSFSRHELRATKGRFSCSTYVHRGSRRAFYRPLVRTNTSNPARHGVSNQRGLPTLLPIRGDPRMLPRPFPATSSGRSNDLWALSSATVGSAEPPAGSQRPPGRSGRCPAMPCRG